MEHFFPFKNKYNKRIVNNCNNDGELRELKSYSQLVSFLDSFYVVTRIQSSSHVFSDLGNIYLTLACKEALSKGFEVIFSSVALFPKEMKVMQLLSVCLCFSLILPYRNF